LSPQGGDSLSTANQWVDDKLFLLLVVDVNSVWNGLQVISGFILKKNERQKKQ
jgi:hypothetical protein